MLYEQEQAGDVCIFRVTVPRLDSSVAAEYKTELLRLVEQEHHRKILVDLKTVEYADSSGLGALLFGLRQARAFDGVLKLVNLNPRVLSLIRIAKLDTVLEAFDDETEAIESFALEEE